MKMAAQSPSMASGRLPGGVRWQTLAAPGGRRGRRTSSHVGLARAAALELPGCDEPGSRPGDPGETVAHNPGCGSPAENGVSPLYSASDATRRVCYKVAAAGLDPPPSHADNGW